MAEQFHHIDSEPDKTTGIDSEYLSGRRYPYQEDRALSQDVDLLAGTPGGDINWLEDIELLSEDGVPAVFDRYTNAFLKIYFDLPDDVDERNDHRPQGAAPAPAVGQLVRHPAEADPHEVPAAAARVVDGGLADGRHRLEGARARGLDAERALS